MEISTELDNKPEFKGRIKPGEKRNPTGKGGFAERPETISPGGWKKENVVSYQIKRFMNMSENEFRAFSKTPTDEITMAMRLAYNRVREADQSLADFKEVTDRTEGRAVQKMEIEAEVHTIDSILE